MEWICRNTWREGAWMGEETRKWTNRCIPIHYNVWLGTTHYWPIQIREFRLIRKPILRLKPCLMSIKKYSLNPHIRVPILLLTTFIEFLSKQQWLVTYNDSQSLPQLRSYYSLPQLISLIHIIMSCLFLVYNHFILLFISELWVSSQSIFWSLHFRWD
mgnify:CR=1 FL=1